MLNSLNVKTRTKYSYNKNPVLHCMDVYFGRRICLNTIRIVVYVKVDGNILDKQNCYMLHDTIF